MAYQIPQQYYPNYTYGYPQPQNNLFQPRPEVQMQQEKYGFINVANEEQARNWPIAPGNSLTFKDESAPYIYTKTMGLSQFETPVFEKYKLTKEEDADAVAGVASPQVNLNLSENEEFSNIVKEIEVMRNSYKDLKNELNSIKNWMKQSFKVAEEKNEQ